MDIGTQAKNYGFKLERGKKVVIEHLIKKHSIWVGFFFIAYGIFKLAVRPNPIFGGISIVLGIIWIVYTANENKYFDLRNLDIKHVVAGNNKLAIEYKSGRVERFEAGEVEKFDVVLRRSAGQKQVGTLYLENTEGKRVKVMVALDSDSDKLNWFLEGVAEALAGKLNEAPEAEAV